MPKNPDRDVARRWSQRLRRFERCNATVAQFCQQEGVSTAAFYQWRRKLRTQPLHMDDPTTPPFVPVHVVADDDADHAIQIRLPNGAVVVLPGVMQMHDVCQLVTHVAALQVKEDATC